MSTQRSWAGPVSVGEALNIVLDMREEDQLGLVRVILQRHERVADIKARLQALEDRIKLVSEHTARHDVAKQIRDAVAKEARRATDAAVLTAAREDIRVFRVVDDPDTQRFVDAKLKPCRLCGSRPRVVEVEPAGYVVECTGELCGISTRIQYDHGEGNHLQLLREVWNREPPRVTAADDGWWGHGVGHRRCPAVNAGGRRCDCVAYHVGECDFEEDGG